MLVIWLALATFAIGTEAFVIAGLLPAISADLGISPATAGQLVTAYSLAYAIGSPLLAVVLNNVDRKTVLILALAVFIASNLLAVIAPGYPLLIISRVLMALGAGLCTPTAIGVAVAISAPERRGRAVALVTSGLTVATVIGVPLGTFVGSQASWRATFALVAALGALALIGVLLRVPAKLPHAAPSLGSRLAIARHASVIYAVVTTMLWAIGGLTVFTYLAVPLHGLGFTTNQISVALLVFGSAAAVGNVLGGILADRIGPTPTMALSLAGMAAALGMLSVTVKTASPELSHVLVLVPIGVWGLCGWSFFPAQAASLIRIEPQAATVALSLNSSFMYFGFALGGALGGIVLSTAAPADLGWVGGLSVGAGLAVLILRHRRERLKPV
ncbi:Putative Permease of the major facilitator superfamily [Bradyrhizobium sp. ORS 278]|uniref:MFS transporter n=1 Tax=Bradyrhizobium sp. (strain ORS 278) TaxID=114615 RepID=UPI0001507EE5|nr:MFS transporter [Bradyrhizobium sp. ORS 278]CAL75222.1 Putative Permease of the major facilitator superfamily [Bradyrhizobium sp. ORS 278]